LKKRAVVICLCLFLSGCTYQEVNEYSLFKYRHNDDIGMTTLKTAGNVIPWTVEATAVGAVYGTLAAFYLGILYLQSKQ